MEAKIMEFLHKIDTSNLASQEIVDHVTTVMNEILLEKNIVYFNVENFDVTAIKEYLIKHIKDSNIVRDNLEDTINEIVDIIIEILIYYTTLSLDIAYINDPKYKKACVDELMSIIDLYLERSLCWLEGIDCVEEEEDMYLPAIDIKIPVKGRLLEIIKTLLYSETFTEFGYKLKNDYLDRVHIYGYNLIVLPVDWVNSKNIKILILLVRDKIDEMLEQ